MTDGQDLVRVGIVGSGWWASSQHIPSLTGHPGADVVAIADPLLDRARRVAAQHGVGHVFGSAEELYGSGRVDAVIIATPHVTHYPLVKAALEHGLHVLVEKPMVTRADHAFELVGLAERAGQQLAIGYTYQYGEVADFVRDAVQSRIGDLVQVIVQFSSNAGQLFAAANDDQQGDSAAPDQPHASTYGAALGGGQAHTQLTHPMGMVCWATGREVRDVVAFTDDHGLDVDVDDVAAFRFSGGGTGVAASTGGTTHGSLVHHHVRYLGSDGVVDHDLLGTATLIGPDQRESVSPTSGSSAYRSHEPARHFVEVVAGRAENRSPARPAAATVAFLDALLTSARTGQVVPVAQLPRPAAERST